MNGKTTSVEPVVLPIYAPRPLLSPLMVLTVPRGWLEEMTTLPLKLEEGREATSIASFASRVSWAVDATSPALLPSPP